MSLRCPRCTRPLRLEDVTLAQAIEGRLDTLGHVHLMPASALSGELVCGELTNDGRLRGRVLVHGKIELSDKSLTTGNIRGQSLTVLPGATITGRARIGPTIPTLPDDGSQ